MQPETLPASETHPLRVIATAAEEAHRLARSKVNALVQDRSVSSDDPVWLEALQAEARAEEALDAARAAISGSDCPRLWIITEEVRAGSHRYYNLIASSPKTALDSAVRAAQRHTSVVRVTCRETGECLSMHKTRTLQIEEKP